jgi:hypothetical protein
LKKCASSLASPVYGDNVPCLDARRSKKTRPTLGLFNERMKERKKEGRKEKRRVVTGPATHLAKVKFIGYVSGRESGNLSRNCLRRRLRPTLKPSTEIVSKVQEFVDIYRFPPLRPAPIYPTPQVDKPAAKCRKDVCLLPDCSCGGADIPGTLI